MLRKLLVLLVLLVAACSSRPSVDTGSDLQLAVTVSPTPAVVGENLIEVSAPAEVVKLEVEATMTHPGMTPVVATPARVSPGRYRGPLKLTMGGDWVLILKLEMPGGRKVQREFPLRGVRSAPP